MLNIARQKGHGALVELLGPGGSLESLAWTSEWRGGLPTARSGIENGLTRAETELSHTLREEERKEREF